MSKSQMVLIPCEGRCPGATQHNFSHEVRLHNGTDLIFMCIKCGAKRVYGHDTQLPLEQRLQSSTFS